MASQTPQPGRDLRDTDPAPSRGNHAPRVWNNSLQPHGLLVAEVRSELRIPGDGERLNLRRVSPRVAR